MDILLKTHGPGVHYYLPFRSFENKNLRKISKLQDLCKNTILKFITLRRFQQVGQKLHLPTPIFWYMTMLSTNNFEEIECAPFFDAFSTNFFHRALTYRVFCFLDNQEYMVMHGYSPCEENWIGTYHRGWVEVQHENIMCVCALVLDPETNNIFYLFDKPNVSLVQICTVLCKKKIIFPEVLLWRLVIDITSALSHILSQGLHYGKFGLDNIFVLNGRVVLENCLTRKSWRSEPVNYHSEILELSEFEREALACVCLRHLARGIVTQNCSSYYSESLFDFLDDGKWPKTLSDIKRVAKEKVTTINSPFSFSKLVDSLKHSDINEDTDINVGNIEYCYLNLRCM